MKKEAFRAGRVALILAGVLSIGAGAGIGAAEPGGKQPEATGPWFRDGTRRVEVERLGPPAVDGAGRMLAPVKLRYPGRAFDVPASVDRTAIVKVDPGAEEELTKRGVRLIRPLMASIGLWLVEDEGAGDGLDVATRLADPEAKVHGIREAMPNLYMRLTRYADPYVPDDPRLQGQWYFTNLRMTEAWGISQGDPSSSIVVVDTGCDLVHPDLAAKMDPGRDVVDQDDDPSYDPTADGTAHGTECAGLVGAVTNNGEGIAGGCPACRIRCVRMLSDDLLPVSASIEAFDFALQVDAAVVSNSWGYVDAIPVPSTLADAINNVFDNGRGGRGALVLFAAGNDDAEIQDDELQAVRGVLCVGAINNFDEQTSFTNYGNAVDVVVPTGTLTTDISGAEGDDPSDYTSLFGGTSSSCPVAAGIAGLLTSAAPDRTSAELYEILIKTARPAPFAIPDVNGHDPIYGFGILQPVEALEEALGTVDPPDAGPGAGGAGGGGGAGAGAADPPGDDEGGCACSTAAAPAAGLPVALFGAALLIGRARRRLRRAR